MPNSNKLEERKDGPIEALLRIEHESMANRLGFTERVPAGMTDSLLIALIGELDRRSRRTDEYSARVVVTICALIWTHCQKERKAIAEILLLMLSRVGYSVSGVMVDEGYDHQKGQLAPMQSWLSQCAIAIRHLTAEVTVGEKTVLLSDPQKRIWDKISNSEVLGVSAPTSAGKSFIITLKTIDLLLERSGTVIYIVPTLSLVSQVAIDFQEQLKEYGLSKYTVSTTYNKDRFVPETIFVFTQEKALAAFNQSELPFPSLRMLVVDEIQNIERVANEDDQRAKRLYDVIMEFRHSSKIDHVVISGPRITGLKELGVEMFGVESESETVKSSPVASLTYSLFRKSSDEFLFRQYSELFKDSHEIVVSGNRGWKWFGQSYFTDEYYDFLQHFVENLGDNSINIIFSPTAPQARRTAVTGLSRGSFSSNRDIDSLVSYLSETVHPKYDLCAALKSGVAYHHGKVPPHARRAIEYAISKRMVRNIVCTTTLMQGVNLPAQNVIIRTPKLFVKKYGDSAVLTNYELANLRGRAGRLFKDLLGRAFVLEENSFLEDEQGQDELFTDEHKELQSGYGQVYREYRGLVDAHLSGNLSPTMEGVKYSYLMTYIRQAILRYGYRAEDRLRSVGIFLEPSLREKVEKALSRIEVPKAVCFENRYWDPLDLDIMYRDKRSFEVPTDHKNWDLAKEIAGLLKYMRDQFPYYCDRYFEVPYKDGKILHYGISASDWLKEKSLSELLGEQWYDNSDKIERGIETFHNKISFGLPSLLKPMYDIKAPSSMLLRFIEYGAFHPVTRLLIEENVPREVAIRLRKRLTVAETEELLASGVHDLLGRLGQRMDFWDRVQLRGVG